MRWIEGDVCLGWEVYCPAFVFLIQRSRTGCSTSSPSSCLNLDTASGSCRLVTGVNARAATKELILISLNQGYYLPPLSFSSKKDNSPSGHITLVRWLSYLQTTNCIWSHLIVFLLLLLLLLVSVQFQSLLCPTLRDPMNCSTPGLPVHHQLPEFTQTHVHRVRDAIQPSHPLSSPSPPAPNPSQHQGLFQWVNSSHQVAEVLEFQL